MTDENTLGSGDGMPWAAPPPRTAGLLGRLYREEREVWRQHYRKYFKSAARALGIGFVAGFFYFLFRPGDEKKAIEFVVRALKDIPVGGPPLVLALTLFYHNARASAVAVAAGLVPFLYLPILDPVLNGGVLGLLCSVARHQGLNVPRLVLTQILPHGIIELFAVLYATCLGLYVSAAMGRKVRAACPGKPQGREDALEPSGADAAAPRGHLVRNVVRSFVLVVLPLLLVAALIEGFITPSLR